MRSLISLDFPAPEMEPETHMWYQLSPFPSSNVAICDAPLDSEMNWYCEGNGHIGASYLSENFV